MLGHQEENWAKLILILKSVICPTFHNCNPILLEVFPYFQIFSHEYSLNSEAWGGSRHLKCWSISIMINTWCTTSCPRSLNFHCNMLYFLPHCLHVTIRYNPVFFPRQFLPKPTTWPLQTIRKAALIWAGDVGNRTGLHNLDLNQTCEKQCPIATLGRCVHSILCATRFVLQSLMKIISAKAHKACPHTTRATEHPQLSYAHPIHIPTWLDLRNLIRLQSWI